jgi:chorismate mutase/prephenate dehydratase
MQKDNANGKNKSVSELLKPYRERIDEIDETILELLIERAKLAQKIGEIKKEAGLEIHVPEREREIIERLLRKNRGRFPETALVRIFREIISACLSLEKPLKVGYLGPKATFTHQAALELFGISAKYVSLPTIKDVFEEVERGNVDYGVVPVENTIEGVVNYTLDMFLQMPTINIVGEVIIPVSLHLLSLANNLEEIKRVYSHPHALAQARGWLEKHLPNAQRIEVESTAKAAELALEDEEAAAIASGAAATVYNLNILANNIQENLNNYTRFLVIGKKKLRRTGKDKTSLLFAVKDEAGALYKALEPFYKHGVNLTKIESRPSKEKSWDYVFFVDIEGHAEEDKVKKAIEELKSRTKLVRLLGSYPSALEKSG